MNVMTIQYNFGKVSETLDEAYSRLMWPQGRGFPTHPQLDQNLPSEYIKYGVRVGDVGIVTYQGYFDYLFNIFLPADHPLNKGRVPEGFVPLRNIGVVQYHEIEEKIFKSDNSIEIKTETLSSLPGEEKIHYTTIWPDTMGAIMALPEGGHSEDILDVEEIRRYTCEHAISWYRHIRSKAAVNGSLHVVTGTDKAAVCARVTKKAAIPQLPPSQTVEFMSRSYKDSENNRFCEWNLIQGGGMQLRCRPGENVIIGEYNHCIFLRSFCVQLSSSEYRKVFRRERKGILGLWGLLGSFRGDRVTVTALFKPRSDAAHPSRLITSYLLNKSRNAKLAIVHHDDWKLLTNEGDRVIPEKEELIGRLKANFKIEIDKGSKAVSIKPKKRSVSSG